MSDNPKNSRTLLLVIGGVFALFAAGAVGGMVGSHADGRDHYRNGSNGRMHEGGPMNRGQAGGGMMGQGGGQGMMGRGGGQGMMDRGDMDEMHPGAGMGMTGDASPRELMRTALKDHLNISDKQLKKAMEDTVDDLLKDRKISKDQAATMKKMIAEHHDGDS